MRLLLVLPTAVIGPILLLTLTSCGRTSEELVDPLACENLPRVQGPSQPCCPAHGVDACGAHLFCASFDGRTVATCYYYGNQLGGMGCKEDSHCASQSCNLAVGLCRGTVGSKCVQSAGCTRGAACFGETCTPTAGGPTAICDDDRDCQSGFQCVQGRCGKPNGAECESGDHASCASRVCRSVGGWGGGTCEACSGHDECEAMHGGRHERCEAGRCIRTCRNQDHCSVISQNASGCSFPGSGCEPYSCVIPAGSSDGLCR
jgi:hypothetical protein